MTETNGFYAGRNAATRIEIFDELSPLAEAALRSFFRRLGAPHVMDEVVLPLLSEGDSQLFAAVRDRPWPPWGLGARNVVGLLQTHLVADACWGLSTIYLVDEELGNIGLQSALIKEALEFISTDPNAEIHYLVAEGSMMADHVLRETGFEATQDVFLTEAARYFTYRTPARRLLERLGLSETDTVDVMAGALDRAAYARGAVFHHTVQAASRADWMIDRPEVAAEITRLVRGGHYSKPGGVPTGTGRIEVIDPAGEVALVLREFLTRDEQAQLLEHVLKNVHGFTPGTIIEPGSPTPLVNERVRRGRTLDDLGRFESLFKERIKQQLEEVMARLGHPAFPLGEIELQVTASNDGDYFRMHRDTDGSDTRELTFVYLFSREPRKFAGGELRVFETDVVEGRMVPTDRSQTIMPRANLAVYFPARHEHEVLPVRVPSKQFDDSRFSITGWIHRR
ncbi:hypothetical protein HCN51_05090 [Nonomuraea sp. FMUSA5-5]|uniref:Fe2OG dioxygenase domain-containing protein n=1 Tax=Nonomuraea composti TaxID=2720023 RepID=A0ABX1AXC8_9ACTN|nr:2OG-Fe(II) oxygenase [Nonomuraea sp. FMUSA5-5]NJP88837.1 hypothetical protein [Nonomuraea sp. FMUSA5-5]